MRYESLSLAVGEAKTRIELEPHVISVMEELQRREHERAVGAYEELLTLFLRDVLPGHREVVMDLRTERSLPALDVYLRKGEGLPLEDALSGTGGSVTNILSAGLRFIALVRSGKRPFLVLDEPDCWIKPELAPKFAGVIQSVAEQLGVQVLMISHHDEQMFEAILPHRLRLEKNDQSLAARWAPTSSMPDWQPEQPGMRSIELINFQSHAHTIIPLSPGLTLINGDNDIGKSAIVSALRSVFDADSNDQHIRHHAKSARVILDFGPDKILSWERFRKGTHKAVYELREAGTPAQSEPIRKSVGARDVPEWVQEFGIGLIDDLDVQLANQKEPVFLLSKTARERAKALAIGGENAHVQEMLSLGKQELGEAKLTVKAGERELENLHRARQILDPLEGRDTIVQSLETVARAIEQKHQENEKLVALLARWTRTKASVNALAALSRPMPTPPDAPADDGPPRALVARWTRSRSTKAALQPLREAFRWTLPAAPEDLAIGQGLLRRWEQAQDTVRILNPISQKPFLATVPEVAVIHGQELANRWRKANQRVMALRALADSRMPQLIEAPADANTQLVHRWKTAQAKRIALRKSHLVDLPSLPPHPEETIGSLLGLMSKWGHAKLTLADARASLDQATQALSEVKRKMEEQADVACPTCGRAFDTEHNHSRREDLSA